MSASEPDGCFFQWMEHTCLEDLGHEGDHECSCGAIKPTEREP